MIHPNRALAKVTMILPTHAHIEEYFSQESDAHQACNVFASSRGYDPAVYCHHANYQPLWEAGWLCATYVQWFNNCPAFYLGDFYYPQCPIGQSPNRDTGVCELPPKSNGSSGCSNNVDVANPINAGTGNKWQHETDLTGGAFGLAFDRYYNASTTANAADLGSGWGHAYARSITVQSVGAWVTIRRQDGKEYNFSQSAGIWITDADVPDRLDELKDSSNVRIGWRYTTADNAVEIYNAAGKLTAITGRAGLTQTLNYSDASTPVTIAPTINLLIRVTDTFGRQLNFTYDSNSRISTLTDPAGGLFHYAYDTNNNLASVTYPDGKSKTYHYENTGLSHALTGITDENGNRYATYVYDAQGRATSTEHADGVDKYSLAYSADGGNTSITDPLGSIRITNFTTILGVVKSTGNSQPAGSGCAASASKITYDANGNIASRTDFNGNRTNYSYDLTRNLETSRTEALTAAGTSTPETRTITTEWHPSFRLPVKITEPGQETIWIYDSQGNITQKTRKDTATAKTRTWSISYSYSATVPGALLQKVENGPRTDVTDVTTTDYYAPDAVCTGGHFGCRGEISQLANALGQSTRIIDYNAHGQPETVIDPNGLVTTLAYDARQRLINIDIGGETTRFRYDNAGQLIQLTRADNSTLNYSYDAAHRLTQISDGLDNKIVYTRDAMGNRTNEDLFDPAGQLAETRRSEYDALSRLAKDIGANNQTTQYSYDSQGNLTGRTDPLNHTTSHDYDSLDRLIETINPANETSRHGVDNRDNLTAVTDPKGNTTQYNYDGLNNLIREVSPDRGTLDYTYDNAGNLKTRIDARGVKHTYTYDALNRPSKRTHATVAGIPATTNVTWSYDQGINGIGHLTGMTDESGNTGYAYDPQGRLLTKTQTTKVGTVSFTQKLTSVYNTQGHLTTQTYPSGLQIGYGYDAQGRINSLSANGQVLLNNLTYQPFGPPKSWTWGNGQPYTRNFDSDGRLADYPLGSDNRFLTYDAAGRITAYSHNTAANNQSFDYDLADRLNVYNDNTGSQTYQYDANGSRTSLNLSGATYWYDTALTSNRLLSVQGPSAKTYSYDAAGNITSDGTTTFTWNAGGRLSKAAAGTNSNTYKHSGLGERVIKSGSYLTNGPYRFIYDPAGHLVGEYDKNNALRQETVWLGDMPVAVVKKDPATQQFLIYYIHTDHLNAPRVILNNANSPVWRWDHADAFGNTLPNEDPDGDGKKFEYNLRFPGQYYDKETGLHYNYFRDYDPKTGRYPESDPIGLAGGINTYAYAGNNPLNAIDPDGLNPLLLLRLLAAFMPMIDLQMMAVDDVPGGGASRACGVANKTIPSAGGVIRQFEQVGDKTYYRVFSGDATKGSWLTAIQPKSSVWAQEALALPKNNQATMIQEVLVPDGTLLERSRAIPVPEWGRLRGGAEQFKLLEAIPDTNFGSGVPLR